MLNGLCVLIGGLLLMLPGFLTDIVGITLLFPLTRPFYRVQMLRFLERKLPAVHSSSVEGKQKKAVPNGIILPLGTA